MALSDGLRQWERRSNTDRLHQSLGWQTPKEYLPKNHWGMVKPALSHME